MRYAPPYAPPTATLAERILAMSKSVESGCREWVAMIDRGGYGHLRLNGLMVRAHRASYEAFVGPIPEGLVIDHLCFNRRCVEPSHLQVLTHADNSRRNKASLRSECFRGHPRTPENVAWHRNGAGRPLKRVCIPCRQEDIRKSRRLRKQRHLAQIVADVPRQSPPRPEPAR